MFRFLHAADLHLDSPLLGLEAQPGAPVERLRGATREACRALVDLAIAERVAFVVIAGDVYDGDWKDYGTGLFFRGQLARLTAARIPVFLIAGNHDAASVITRQLSLPEGVAVFSTRAAESMDVPGLPVVIHGRGFPNRAVPENLAADYPAAVPDRFNIGLLHTSLTGREGHDTYAPCTEADLRQKGYDYWALGHVHQPEIVAKDPWMVFPGNTQGRHIREEGARGCRLVSVGDDLRVTGVESRSLDVIRWRQVPVDLTAAGVFEEVHQKVGMALSAAVDEAEGRLLAVRVVLQGATVLHGALHRDIDRCRAEVLAAAQDAGVDRVWVERVRIATAPLYELSELARRDDLTRMVIEGLEAPMAGAGARPGEIDELLRVLPPAVRGRIEAELSGPGWDALRGDVRAILLEAMQTSGAPEVEP